MVFVEFIFQPPSCLKLSHKHFSPMCLILKTKFFCVDFLRGGGFSGTVGSWRHEDFLVILGQWFFPTSLPPKLRMASYFMEIIEAVRWKLAQILTLHLPTYQLFSVFFPLYNSVDVLSTLLFKASSPELITSYMLKGSTLIVSPLLPHLIRFCLYTRTESFPSP